MAFFSKSDLFYDDYSWTTYGKDDPEITGKPDDTFFSRKEGYEVLYLINNTAKASNWKEKESGTKMEILIHDELPSDIRSQKNVLKWLKDHWN